MYDQTGDRVHVTNPTAEEGGVAIPNNTPCVLGGHVGWVEKNTQLTRWVEPGSEQATHVMPGEAAVLFIDDVHELALSGGISGAAVGDKLYIDAADNTVHLTPVGTGAANEKQSVKVAATGGTFTLEFDGETTGAIAFNATAAEVREALEALSNIAVGDVAVTGGVGDEAGTKPYVVVFEGAYADTDVPQLIGDESSLTIGEEEGTVTVTTTTAGKAAGVLPLGIVDSIDTSRTPHVARVNQADLKPFLTV